VAWAIREARKGDRGNKGIGELGGGLRGKLLLIGVTWGLALEWQDGGLENIL